MTTPTSRVRRAAVPTAIGLMLLVALAACGSKARSSAAEAPPTIDVTARDFGFDMGPTRSVGSGLVTVRLHNAGAEDHQVQLARLHEGVTADRFTAALRSGGEKEAFALIDFAGGSNAVVPGGFQETVDPLVAGDYVMVCLVPSPNGTPHLAKGMVTSFRVVGTKGGGTVPETIGDIHLRDYGFAFPSNFRKGTYKVINDGPQPHELTLVRLVDGKTPTDVAIFFASGGHGPPPFSSAGGVGAVMPGASAYGRLDLAPGNYLALCYVPDAGSGMRHAAMGIVQPFNVT